MENWRTILTSTTGFDWDLGNVSKSWAKHRVSPFESEEVFFNQPILIIPDEEHSRNEKRFYALGKTDKGKHLFVSFTVREHKIRVISARTMSRKERSVYQSHEEKETT